MILTETALVTHNGCMDGSTCALVFMACGGKKENIFFTTPSHDDTNALVKYLAETWQGNIIVADASISLSLAERLNKTNTNIRIFDHHKTAIPLNKFSWCEIDVENTRAGGKMLYDYCQQHIGYLNHHRMLNLKELVDAADAYDRWTWNGDELIDNLALFHDAVEQESFIERFNSNPYLLFNEKEQYLVDVKKAKRERFVEKKKQDAEFVVLHVQGHNIKVGVVEAGTHQSILGNAICSDPELKADVTVMVNSRSVSLRASADCPVDLSKVAKINGGGGHAKAAGVALSNLLKDDFLNMVFERVRWE